MTQVALDDLVPAVRAMWQSAMGSRNPFHLQGCSCCGAPSFGYPCATCRAYPDGNEPKAVTEARRAGAERSGVGSRESFVASVEKAGGIGAWYFAGFRRTVAYQGSGSREPPDHAFREAVDGLVERATQVPWPSPGEVWDRVTRDGAALHGDWQSETAAWDRLAAAEHGADSLRGLKERQEGRSWHPWPDNCRAGQDVVRAHGAEILERLGIPEAGRPAERAAYGMGR